jgi:hypothetical protein
VLLEVGDPDTVGNPHVLRVEEVFAVEPNISDGSQPVELELPSAALESSLGGVETTAIPPFASVEQIFVVVPPMPPSELSERSGRGPGHLRRHPHWVLENQVGHVQGGIRAA